VAAGWVRTPPQVVATLCQIALTATSPKRGEPGIAPLLPHNRFGKTRQNSTVGEKVPEGRMRGPPSVVPSQPLPAHSFPADSPFCFRSISLPSAAPPPNTRPSSPRSHPCSPTRERGTNVNPRALALGRRSLRRTELHASPTKPRPDHSSFAHSFINLSHSAINASSPFFNRSVSSTFCFRSINRSTISIPARYSTKASAYCAFNCRSCPN
jgi:hypothetical protein